MSTSTGRSIHTHEKKDRTLFKIITGIIVLGIIAVGVIQFSVWVQSRITSDIESTAKDTLTQTEDLIANNDAEGALALLTPILERVDNPEITPKALLLEAQIHEKAGRTDLSKDNLQKIIDHYPESSDFPKAAVQYAHILEEDGNREEALILYQQIRNTAPPVLRASATTALAREKERTNDIDGALKMYKVALSEAPWGSESWNEAVSYLGDLNTQMLFSTTHTPDSKVYTVVRGDNLTAIGSKLNITQGQLLRANGLDDPKLLRPNQILKYTPKDFQIIVERSTCRIFLLDREGIFKVYYSGLGKAGYDTTLGKYKIGNKEKNPVWHKPGSTPIPSGAPENELGSRWLPMVPEEEGLPRDLGIHGTIHPDSIGKYSSKGCPRMHNAEVEELYDLVVRSTPVQVVDTYIPSP
jgi:lipoprotein-anchoring transpeptidase ErfK/SrfK